MYKKIDINDLWLAIDGGKPVILDYYPQAQVGFSGRKNFRMRTDDKSPSASVFRETKNGGKFWYIQDKGGGDNKARNAIDIVMENENLPYKDALVFLAQKYAPQLLSDDSAKTLRQAEIEKAPLPLDEMVTGLRPDGKFTADELKVLGYEITDEHCRELNIKPLDYYITQKNNQGSSYIIKATPDYPMFYFDYGEFGKIYQPFGGDFRFVYKGKKPENYIFGDVKVSRMITEARAGKFPEDDNEKIEQLIICSGTSDALNVSANGYHVCWANSETANIDTYSFYLLKKIAQEIFILYDLDDAGIEGAYRIALKNLDFRIIWLPDDLQRFRDRKGKPCKDAKDFFVHYRTPKHRNPKKYFDILVKTSQSLKFWLERYTPKGDFTGYDIDNEQLYGFLNANGIYKIETNISRKGFTFCKVIDNIVTRIDEDNFPSYVNNFLINFIKENPEHYSKQLINSIHRSNQVKLASLEKIKFKELDMKSFGKDFDFMFFKNTSLKISKEGLTSVKLKDLGKYVYDFKIIDHEFIMLDPPFDISYSKKYTELKKKFKSVSPHSSEYDILKQEYDGLPECEKYELNIYDSEFSFLKYLYNTSRIYYKKEIGGVLTEAEKKETDLCFIAKICAIGYLLYRYKENSQAYLVYATETELGDEGEHRGGTGKSILFDKAIEYCRSQVYIDGQTNIKDDDCLFSGVEQDVTEIVYFNDLNKHTSLHKFLGTVTEKMTVRALYSNKIVLPFEKSPKVSASSNHAIKDFDGSLRRRTWFVAFGPYYHPEDKNEKIKEFNPYIEFGKNLITDYNDDEMNHFYNFMAWCLHTYLKFRQRIQPPMAAIEKRNLQREMTDELLWWAEDWFTPDKLNINISNHEVFNAYKETLPDKYKNSMTIKTFTRKLQLFCQYKGYEYNPKDLLKTESEKQRNAPREYKDGKDVYCYHIRTKSYYDTQKNENNDDLSEIDNLW
ncbi:MAG: toprim domain-containing protein [Prevotellaceae bacterium]|jgi:hypothetical protein|nr:toprim domain-containing protein [Prevotellaceae bacterium]